MSDKAVSKLQAILEARADTELATEQHAVEREIMSVLASHCINDNYLKIIVSEQSLQHNLNAHVYSLVCSIAKAGMEKQRQSRRDKAVADFVAKVDKAAEKADIVAEELEELKNEFKS